MNQITEDEQRWAIQIRHAAIRRLVDESVDFTVNQHKSDGKDYLPSEFGGFRVKLESLNSAVKNAYQNREWENVISLCLPLLEGALRDGKSWDLCIEYGEILVNAGRKDANHSAIGWGLCNGIGWTLVQRGDFYEGRKKIREGIKEFRLAKNEWGESQGKRFLGQSF